MRLVCSNCDAEYEVDDAAIPRTGRDVQCSNCGHAWFQTHPDIEAEQEAEAALYEPPAAVAPPGPEPEPKPVPPAEAAALVVPEPEFEDEPATPLTPEQAVAATLSASAAASAAPPAAAAPIAPSRALDESVLAVLREEAAREVAARKSDTPPRIETQTEMGLNAADAAAPADGLAAAARRIARLKGVADPEPPPAPKTRREMLPAIEEINSSLRATSDRHSDEDNAVYDTMPDLNPKRSGFGRGFLTVVVLAVIVVALYLAAPLIGQRVPALAGPAQTYVATVDAVRLWVDTEIKALIATLRGYAGGQGG